MADVNQGWLALAAAILGGSGLKLIEYWLGRSKARYDYALQFRDELREEIKSLKEELHMVEKELEHWRDRYYEVMEEFIALKQQRWDKDGK